MGLLKLLQRKIRSCRSQSPRTMQRHMHTLHVDAAALRGGGGEEAISAQCLGKLDKGHASAHVRPHACNIAIYAESPPQTILPDHPGIPPSHHHSPPTSLSTASPAPLLQHYKTEPATSSTELGLAPSPGVVSAGGPPNISIGSSLDTEDCPSPSPLSRPQPARSPFEWMKKPSHPSPPASSDPNGKFQGNFFVRLD